jgi:hypothetical protein
MSEEAEELGEIITRSATFGTKLVTDGNQVRVVL